MKIIICEVCSIYDLLCTEAKLPFEKECTDAICESRYLYLHRDYDMRGIEEYYDG